MFYETKTPGAHGMKHSPFKQLVVPRPIGWVSSLSNDGKANLAPFSFFNAVSDSPPMVMFSVNGAHVDGPYKDTLENVVTSGEFVVNLATWDLRAEMNASSANARRDVDEFELAGLQKAVSNLVKPPRVAAAPAALECKFHTAVMLPSNSPKVRNTTVFGHVVGVHIREDLIVDGLVDIAKVQPIARLGYMDYATVTPDRVFTMQRPD
jgi:flavin reductase (DIM6/NTAB) family NADH-FMN oxidoreductase RutF